MLKACDISRHKAHGVNIEGVAATLVTDRICASSPINTVRKLGVSRDIDRIISSCAVLAIPAVNIATHGRHDPCVGLRAAPIAEAMLALVLMDHALRHRAQNADVSVNTPDIARFK